MLEVRVLRRHEWHPDRDVRNEHESHPEPTIGDLQRVVCLFAHDAGWGRIIPPEALF